ncbi:MAG: hypothetical protein ABWX59_07145 [Microbacteriaceae bacterium]
MFCRTAAGVTGAPATAAIVLTSVAEADVMAIAIGVPIGLVVVASIAALFIWQDRSGGFRRLLHFRSLRRRRRRD